jgi:hypothetical protein
MFTFTLSNNKQKFFKMTKSIQTPSVSTSSVETKIVAPKASLKSPKAPKAEKVAKVEEAAPVVAKVAKVEKIKVVRAPRKNTVYGEDLARAYYYKVGETVEVVPAKNSKLPQRVFQGVIKSRFEYFRNAVKCYYITITLDDQTTVTIVKRQSSITDLNPRGFKQMDAAFVKKNGVITFAQFVDNLIHAKKALPIEEVATDGTEEVQE